VKTFIIGAQCTGKTRVAAYLREQTTGFDVVEMDDEIRELCDGEWPDDDVYKEEVLVPQVLGRVSLRENVVFFENHMSVERTQLLRRAGFLVIMLEVQREELLRRNGRRMAEEGYDSIAPYLDSELSNMDELRAHGLVDHVVSGEQPIDQVAQQVLAYSGAIP
jgi:hypothetical protein